MACAGKMLSSIWRHQRSAFKTACSMAAADGLWVLCEGCMPHAALACCGTTCLCLVAGDGMLHIAAPQMVCWAYSGERAAVDMWQHDS